MAAGDDGHHVQGLRRHGEKKAQPRDHVNAGGHHRRRVNQRANGCRSGHGIRQPDMKRDLRRLTRGADEEKQGRHHDHGQSPDHLSLKGGRPFGDLAKRQGSMSLGIQGPEKKKHTEDEAKVTDAVHDEGLVAGPGIALILVPESDQRIGAQSDAFPTDEHQQQAIAQHQGEHRGGKKIEIGEEAPEGLVIVHVAGGIDVDQTADPGNDQNHHRGKWVHREGHIDFERAETDPGIESIDKKTAFGVQSLQGKEGNQRKTESDDNRRAGNETDRPLAHAFLNLRPQKTVDDRADQRQENDPAEIVCLYRIIHFPILDFGFFTLDSRKLTGQLAPYFLSP